MNRSAGILALVTAIGLGLAVAAAPPARADDVAKKPTAISGKQGGKAVKNSERSTARGGMTPSAGVEPKTATASSNRAGESTMKSPPRPATAQRTSPSPTAAPTQAKVTNGAAGHAELHPAQPTEQRAAAASIPRRQQTNGARGNPPAAAAPRVDQQIRDKQGRLLGRIREVSSGRHEARDASGRLLGTYDPKSDQTRDPSGRLLAKGDVLGGLVYCKR